MLGPHVVTAPQTPETLTAYGQFAHEFHQAGIVDVGSDVGPQGGDPRLGQFLPVPAQFPFGLVEKDGPQDVDAGGVGRGQGRRQCVGREHIGESVLDVRGIARPSVDELEDAGRHGLGLSCGRSTVCGAARLTRLGRARLRQADQVRGGGGVQVQHVGQGFEDLERRVAVAALLKAQVVVGADPGQHRDLLAPQSRHAPQTAVADPGVLGPYQRATGPQELSEGVRCVHDSTVGPSRRR
ncbi:hypothetical protein GCM10010306_034080 [Streptomyces umbrinus]|nr:hypothetical protein GCM10010306_034080 [Streptomyces umbrinus]